MLCISHSLDIFSQHLYLRSNDITCNETSMLLRHVATGLRTSTFIFQFHNQNSQIDLDIKMILSKLLISFPGKEFKSTK